MTQSDKSLTQHYYLKGDVSNIIWGPVRSHRATDQSASLIIMTSPHVHEVVRPIKSEIHVNSCGKQSGDTGCPTSLELHRMVAQRRVTSHLATDRHHSECHFLRTPTQRKEGTNNKGTTPNYRHVPTPHMTPVPTLVLSTRVCFAGFTSEGFSAVH